MKITAFVINKSSAELAALDPPDLFLGLATATDGILGIAPLGSLGLEDGDKISLFSRDLDKFVAHVEDAAMPTGTPGVSQMWIVLD